MVTTNLLDSTHKRLPIIDKRVLKEKQFGGIRLKYLCIESGIHGMNICMEE